MINIRIIIPTCANVLNLSHTDRCLKVLIFRNLPEVRSAHEVLGIPTVSARFGTAPFFWNWGMEAMTNLLSPVTCIYLPT